MNLKANPRKTQQQRILDLLLEGFRHGREIPLPEILNLRIAMYPTRILELRRAGWKIVNRMEMVDGQKHSFYKLESAWPEPVMMAPKTTTSTVIETIAPTVIKPAEQPSLLTIPQQSWADPEVA